MDNIKKNALKIVVLIALFASAAFADGDMGSGGLAGGGNGNNSGEIVITQPNEDGSTTVDETSDTDNLEAILLAIYEYLNQIP
jgi:hypothetical protein